MAAGVVDTEVDGFPGIALRAGELESTWIPELGMIGCSLRHRGAELLGQRNGLRAYAERGSTMGIPLLHPWANRLDGLRYAAAGVAVELDPDGPAPLRLDPSGLPIHGVMAAAGGWEVRERAVDGGAAVLQARFDFGARTDLLAAFPFPHVLDQRVELRPGGLRVATRVLAGPERPVPVAFGHHPYLQLPGIPRSRCEIEMAAASHLILDERGIPTGACEPAAVAAGPIGDRTFDDGYTDLQDEGAFTLAGAGRRIEVRFTAGYPVSQLYVPPAQELLAYEPMAAPTNALVSGDGLRTVAPGRAFEAVFAIGVR